MHILPIYLSRFTTRNSSIIWRGHDEKVVLCIAARHSVRCFFLNGGDGHTLIRPSEPPVPCQPVRQPSGSRSQSAAEDQEGPKPYADVITGEAESDEGLFTVHRVDESYFFQIPESLYNVDMLLITRIGRVPAGLGGTIVSGAKISEQVLHWERRGDRILLRKVSFNQVAEDSLPIFESVVRNNFAPIVEAFDIEAIGPDGDTVVIDVTDFYSGDTPALSGLSAAQRKTYEVRSLDADRSFINYARSYPLNVDVRHTLTFSAAAPPTDVRAATISMEMHQSMVLLPEDPMMPRRRDDRVGYSSISQVNFGLDELKAAEQTFIRRWRLEPSDPEAYARGELVDPVKSIVYYVDPATPARWRPHVRRGIEDWQAAFETAGSATPSSRWIPQAVRRTLIGPPRTPATRWCAGRRAWSATPWVRRSPTPALARSSRATSFGSTNHLRSYRNRLMIETGASNRPRGR